MIGRDHKLESVNSWPLVGLTEEFDLLDVGEILWVHERPLLWLPNAPPLYMRFITHATSTLFTLN